MNNYVPYLPKITDEIFDTLSDTGLIEIKLNGDKTWSQDAVEFLSVVPVMATRSPKRMNKSACQDLIDGNLKWLRDQPDTLENDHISSIISDSINFYYD